jgi:hypothetical protein
MAQSALTVLASQTQLNAALDLDKGDRQAAEPADNEPESPVVPAAGFPAAAPRRSASPALGA